jgi:hypothetical protein
VFREEGMQVSPVAMLRLSLFATIKEPEGGRGAFGVFTLSFLVWEGFGREKNY